MGADSVIAYFGVRYELSEEEMDACEAGEDERTLRARRAKLDYCFDRPTDGEGYFLYVGRRLANLGVEADVYEELSELGLLEIMAKTKTSLAKAEIAGEPALHFQLIAQY
jgi:hypothetical protein